MNKRTFDVLVIVVIAAMLVLLAQFRLLEQSAKFMLVPILAFYFLGQYVQRKFQK